MDSTLRLDAEHALADAALLLNRKNQASESTRMIRRLVTVLTGLQSEIPALERTLDRLTADVEASRRVISDLMDRLEARTAPTPTPDAGPTDAPPKPPRRVVRS